MLSRTVGLTLVNLHSKLYTSPMIEKIADIAHNCKHIVVLTGAGISAESGVPTFRGKEGLWGKFRPEELATMDAFMSNPEIVWEWYNWRRELMWKVQPNLGHDAITNLENLSDKFTLITQNVDGLHKLADTKNILELHGNIYRNKCVSCNTIIEETVEIQPDAIPSCQKCGGKIRPDVVWFGEMLDEQIIQKAFEDSEKSELFFSIGTSAVVHPAASLPVAAKERGAVLVEINMEATPITPIADYFIAGKSGEILPQIVALIKEKRSI